MASVQFNLLPDVKIEFIKTQARKRLIILSSIVVSAVCLAIFSILFINVKFAQTRHMNDLTRDIKSGVAKIRETNDIDKVLTVQNQLASLPGLHDQKVIASRLSDYLLQVTPSTAKITDVELDFEAKTIKIKGVAPDLATVNKFADTLKFTKYRVGNSDGQEGKAFSNVVLSSFSVQDKATNAQERASFELSFTYDETLFKMIKEKDTPEDKAVKLDIPNITSTRSVTEKPSDLFTKPVEQKEQTDGR